MDARDKILPALRSGGRYVVELYNTIRPHESLDFKPPAPEVFVHAFAIWPAALLPPASLATLRKVQR
jgi:transposase InsO family protein